MATRFSAGSYGGILTAERPTPSLPAAPRRRWRADRARWASDPGDVALRISLDQLLEAEQARRHPSATAQDCRRERELRLAYERTHGAIVDLYVCKNIPAATVITAGDELRLRYPADLVSGLQPEFEEALWRTAAMAREGRQLLVGRRRRMLVEMLQSVVVYLLGVLDSQHAVAAGPGRDGPDAASCARIEKSLVTADRELDRVHAFLRQSAQCKAQHRYLVGMACGVVALPLLATALALVRLHDVPVAPLVVAVVAGGVGAIISVMTRIATGHLALDERANPFVTVLAGAFRPVIGAVLGLAIYVLVQADLVPLAVPTDQAKDVYFFAGLAFLAGFSERWAQDMLLKTAGELPAPGQGEPARPAPPVAAA